MIRIEPTVGSFMSDDTEWGRLYTYPTGGDFGLIMPPRSYYIRDFISGSWTDLAIGMIYCGCAVENETANMVAERQDESAITNLFHFGLTKSVNNSIEVGDNPNFLGIRGIQNSVTQITTSPLQLYALAHTLVNGLTTTTNGNALALPLTQGNNATPFNMIGLRFNYDPVTHLVRINLQTQLGFNLANTAANISTILAFLSNIPTSANTASAAFTINNVLNLKTFYIYWPYVLNRLKLHCIGVRKYG